VSTIDEWLSGDIREDVVGAIEQGASKLDDWLIIAISSEGPFVTVRAIQSRWNYKRFSRASTLRSAYFDLALQARRARRSSRSSMWPKANPNLGTDGFV
jgi:hypothetical protein